MFNDYRAIINFIRSLKKLNDEDFDKITESIVDIEKSQQKYRDNAFYHTPRSLAERVQSELLISKGDIVFDPTCGHGMLLKSLSHKGVQVRGIELTDALSSIAKEFLEKEYGYDNAYITQANTLDIPWEKVEDYNILIANPPFGLRCGNVEIPIFEKMLQAMETGKVKQIITIFPSNFVQKNNERGKLKGFMDRVHKAGYYLEESETFQEEFDNTSVSVKYFNFIKSEPTSFIPKLNKPKQDFVENNSTPAFAISKSPDGKFIISIIEKIINNKPLNKTETFAISEFINKSGDLPIFSFEFKEPKDRLYYYDIYLGRTVFQNNHGVIGQMVEKYKIPDVYESDINGEISLLDFYFKDILKGIENNKKFSELFSDKDYQNIKLLFGDKKYKKGFFEGIEKLFDTTDDIKIKCDIIVGIISYEKSVSRGISFSNMNEEEYLREKKRFSITNIEDFEDRYGKINNEKILEYLMDINALQNIYFNTNFSFDNIFINNPSDEDKIEFITYNSSQPILSFINQVVSFINGNKKDILNVYNYIKDNQFIPINQILSKEKNISSNINGIYSGINTGKYYLNMYKKEKFFSYLDIYHTIKGLIKEGITNTSNIKYDYLLKYITNENKELYMGLLKLNEKGYKYLDTKEFVYVLNSINGNKLTDKNEINDLNDFIQSNNNHLKHLLPYQVDGYRKAIEGIEKFNGFIISDDVGLGKTLVGSAVIGDYIENTNKKILLIAPKSVVDGGAWEKTLNLIGFNDDIIKDRVIITNNQVSNFAKYQDDNNIGLIVLDEAHNFRNNTTKSFYELKKFEKYTIRKDDEGNSVIEWKNKVPMVMLTATPINNSIIDLVNILSLFNPEIYLGINENRVKNDKYYWKSLTQYVSKYDRKRIVQTFGEIEINGAKIKDEYPEINYVETIDGEEYKKIFKGFINDTFKYGIDEDVVNGLSYSQKDLDNVGVASFTDFIGYKKIDNLKLPLQKFFDNGRLTGWEEVREDTYTFKNQGAMSQSIFMDKVGLTLSRYRSKVYELDNIYKDFIEKINEKFKSSIKGNNILLYLFLKNKKIDNPELKEKIDNINLLVSNLRDELTDLFSKDIEKHFEHYLMDRGLGVWWVHSNSRTLDKTFWLNKTVELLKEKKDLVLKELERRISLPDDYHSEYYQVYYTEIKAGNYDLNDIDRKKTAQYLIDVFREILGTPKDKTFWSRDNIGNKTYTSKEIDEYIVDYFKEDVDEIKRLCSGLDVITVKVKRDSRENGIFSGYIGTMILKRLDSSPYALYRTLDKMYLKGLLEPDVDDDDDEKKIISNRGTKALTQEERKKIGGVAEKYKDFLLNPENDSKLKQLISLVSDEKDKQWLIFTAYTDTLEYIYNNLKKAFPHLRIETITGQNNSKERLDKISRFSPKVNGFDKEADIDILIATDSLSEGVNLHDVYRGVNYDLPYNPVRLQQRVGRLFRVGAKNTPVFYNFVPTTLMEELTGIMNIISSKENIIKTFFGEQEFDVDDKDSLTKFISEKISIADNKLDYNSLMQDERKMDIFINNDTTTSVSSEGDEDKVNLITKKFGYNPFQLTKDNKYYIFSEFLNINNEIGNRCFIIPIYHGQILKDVEVGYMGKEDKIHLDSNFYNLLNTTIFDYLLENKNDNIKNDGKYIFLEVLMSLKERLNSLGLYDSLIPKKAGNNLDKYKLIQDIDIPLNSKNDDVQFLIILV